MKAVLIKQKAILIGVGIFCFTFMSAQEDPLANYILIGLENNLVLKQKNISFEKAMLGLETAKSFYLPSISFQTVYSTADGGRNIPLPLGDLLNEAYATLNQLSGSQKFPQLRNESINFLPHNYYDAKIRTTVPILNTDIGYNIQINRQQLKLQVYEMEVYRRELVKHIKIAYFNYLNALQAVSVYESSKELAEEGKRVNEKLLESGKGLPAYVMRAESEVAQAHAKLVNGRQQVENARMYLNSLLNRAADSSIESDYHTESALREAVSRLNEDVNVKDREELLALKQVITLNETVLKMNEQYLIPKLSAFLDLGSQASDFRFNDESRYYMAGIQMEIPVFSGNRNHHKVKQAKLDRQKAILNFEEIKEQMDLSSGVAKNGLRAAYEVYKSSLVQLEAAQTYQRLIDRGYKGGTHSYIETVDARSQLTQARMSMLINKYRVLIADAEVERETASYSMPPH